MGLMLASWDHRASEQTSDLGLGFVLEEGRYTPTL